MLQLQQICSANVSLRSFADLKSGTFEVSSDDETMAQQSDTWEERTSPALSTDAYIKTELPQFCVKSNLPVIQKYITKTKQMYPKFKYVIHI